MEYIYIVEGKNIFDLNSCFKEFAKAVNAPNGYYGSGLLQFDDCLFGGFGLEAPCKIIWNNSDFSKNKLDSQMLLEYYEEEKEFYEIELINEIEKCRQAGVNPDEYVLCCDSIIYFDERIEKAKNGDITMFHEIVEIINSVTKRAIFRNNWIVELVLE